MIPKPKGLGVFFRSAAIRLRRLCGNIADLTRRGYDETLERAQQLKDQTADIYQSVKEKAAEVYDLTAAKLSLTREEPAAGMDDLAANAADSVSPTIDEAAKVLKPALSGRKPSNLM